MCPADWRRVPKPVQRAVYDTWAGGAGAGTPAHRSAISAAIAAVNRVRDREAEATEARRLPGGGGSE
jgi:hypothetical protein